MGAFSVTIQLSSSGADLTYSGPNGLTGESAIHLGGAPAPVSIALFDGFAINGADEWRAAVSCE